MVSFIFGAAVSQLFYGPLSEGIGRKAPIMIGLGIMLVGSILAFLATNLYWLIGARLIQGLGAGACAGLWRSIIRDSLDEKELSKYGFYFVIAITFVAPAAPALGGYLQELFGWHASFLFIMLYSFAAHLLFYFGFKETSAHHHKDKLNAAYIKKTFGVLLRSPSFIEPPQKIGHFI